MNEEYYDDKGTLQKIEAVIKNRIKSPPLGFRGKKTNYGNNKEVYRRKQGEILGRIV